MLLISSCDPDHYKTRIISLLPLKMSTYENNSNGPTEGRRQDIVRINRKVRPQFSVEEVLRKRKFRLSWRQGHPTSPQTRNLIKSDNVHTNQNGRVDLGSRCSYTFRNLKKTIGDGNIDRPTYIFLRWFLNWIHWYVYVKDSVKGM